jgi:hypothetical protein
MWVGLLCEAHQSAGPTVGLGCSKRPPAHFFFNGPKWVGIGLAVAETAWRSREAPVLTPAPRPGGGEGIDLGTEVRPQISGAESRCRARRQPCRTAAPDICGDALCIVLSQLLVALLPTLPSRSPAATPRPPNTNFLGLRRLLLITAAQASITGHWPRSHSQRGSVSE